MVSACRVSRNFVPVPSLHSNHCSEKYVGFKGNVLFGESREMKNAHEKEGLLIEESEQDNEDNKGRKRCLQSFRGVTATFAQVLLFTASATSVQLLERRIPDLELNTFRNAVPAVLYAMGILFTRK